MAYSAPSDLSMGLVMESFLLARTMSAVLTRLSIFKIMVPHRPVGTLVLFISPVQPHWESGRESRDCSLSRKRHGSYRELPSWYCLLCPLVQYPYTYQSWPYEVPWDIQLCACKPTFSTLFLGLVPFSLRVRTINRQMCRNNWSQLEFCHPSVMWQPIPLHLV